MEKRNEVGVIEQYFHVVMYIIPYRVIITFKFVDEILVCDSQVKATVLHNGNELRWCTMRPLPFGYICGGNMVNSHLNENH